jgi:heptosyltransferase II
MKRLVILAPNWLGDAVMALPAIADVARGAPGVGLAVAARPSIAPLFQLVESVHEIVILEKGVGSPFGNSCHPGAVFDTALLLPNSFHAALMVYRAGIPERWGYRTQWRGQLLTRAIAAPSGLHQIEYYQQLVHAVGFPNGPIAPRLAVPTPARESGAKLLAEAGWDGRATLVAIAPGAAYGGAKRWPPASFAGLVAAFVADGLQVVMIGNEADKETAEIVARTVEAGAETRAGVVRTGALMSVVGRTDLPTLAGVLTHCRALVTNDSGAMHLAAAVGVRVTAVFGPTDEAATAPIGDGHAIVAHPVWCRPCMLRECPLDHACMRGVGVATVLDAARRSL